MKDKELKKKIINWFKAQANNADHQTLDNILDQALKAKEEEMLELLKNRQDRFLKKREKLMGKDNYEAGVVIGRLAELEAIKLLLSSLKGKKK